MPNEIQGLIICSGRGPEVDQQAAFRVEPTPGMPLSSGGNGTYWSRSPLKARQAGYAGIICRQIPTDFCRRQHQVLADRVSRSVNPWSPWVVARSDMGHLNAHLTLESNFARGISEAHQRVLMMHSKFL